MIEQARNNLDSLSHKISKSKVSQINTQLSSFEFDPILWEKIRWAKTIWRWAWNSLHNNAYRRNINR